MLQDLDQLAIRMEQLVQRTRHLNADRQALRANLNEKEAEQRTLQQRCAARERELAELQRTLRDQDDSLASSLSEARQAELRLRDALAQETAARSAVESRLSLRETVLQKELAARDLELQRLRATCTTARARIDALLLRLPSVALEEQQ